VLVTLDGSLVAETALPLASRLARSAGARLLLVMVHERPHVPAGPDDLAAQAQERTYLAGKALELGTIGPGPVESYLAEGAAGPVLVAEVERVKPDLVVMTTHGRGSLSRFWLGSVADHVARHVTRPLLLLHPVVAGPPVGEVPMSTCLVPLDGSAQAESILRPVADLARLTQAHITLLHVVEPANQEDRRAGVQRYLDGVADRLRAEGLRVATRVVAGTGVAETVLAQLQQGRFGFVAISTHGVGGFRYLLFGGVADKVMRGGTVPTLLHRPPAT